MIQRSFKKSRNDITRGLIQARPEHLNIDFDVAELLIEYVAWLEQALILAMAAFAVVSFWKPNLCRAYFYIAVS